MNKWHCSDVVKEFKIRMMSSVFRSSDRSSDLSAGRFGEEVQGRDGLQRGQLCHRICSHGGESFRFTSKLSHCKSHIVTVSLLSATRWTWRQPGSLSLTLRRTVPWTTSVCSSTWPMTPRMTFYSSPFIYLKKTWFGIILILQWWWSFGAFLDKKCGNRKSLISQMLGG